jgi:Fusaric acid resistance protein-like
VSWLARHDPGFLALRRAARTAVVMPAMFALSMKVIGNPILATFAAFGSFALLLLADFTGPMRARLQNQALLAATGAVFISVATLASRSAWLAAVAMAVVAFGVLFAGVVSSVLAGATTALLLSFILPVALPGDASTIPDRLAGWGMAAGASLLAIALLWPAPERNPVRSAAIAACRALAARLRSTDAKPESDAAVETLHATFFATPYRPTGLSTSARAVVRLVDELRWLDDVVPQGTPDDESAVAVQLAAASVLERGADLLEEPRRAPGELHAALAELAERLGELERRATLGPSNGDVISALDPTFRAQEMSFVVTQIARNVDLAAAADRRRWIDQLLGRRPAGLSGPLSSAYERAEAHVERHSLWLQNSVRGAIGLGVAVLVANLSGVQHAFWVVLGTLSILRSNALSTGESVVRGLLGTVAGFIVGAALVALIGTNMTVLWLLLAPAVLFAGLAPAVISFAAGQAGFTLTLLILFNILAPEGWQIGLVRIEDVAIGGAIGLGVGLLLWPRGAAADLGRALAEAYADSARYLAAAVQFGLGRCDAGVPVHPAPTSEATGAAAAARRLDDTFRTYLAERSGKPVSMAEVTSLVTGVVGLRLAGDAVLDLWQGAAHDQRDRPAARRELLATSEEMQRWYGAFAASLAGRGEVPAPMDPDPDAGRRLAAALDGDLGSDPQSTATAVRVIWTGDHLDAARRLQATLTDPARAAVRERAFAR